MYHTATLLLQSLYNNPSYYNIAHNDTTQATTPAAQYTPVVGILRALLAEGEVLEVLELLEILKVLELLEVLEILEVGLLEIYEVLKVGVVVGVPVVVGVNTARQSEVGQVLLGAVNVYPGPPYTAIHLTTTVIAFAQAVLTGSWKARHSFWGKGLHTAAWSSVISVLTLSVTQASLSQSDAQYRVRRDTCSHAPRAVGGSSS